VKRLPVGRHYDRRWERSSR